MEQRVKLCFNRSGIESVKIRRGVRQGCCMSPILFNIYGEYFTKEALDEVRDFKIGGRVVNNVMAVIAKTQEEQQDMNRLIDA